MNELGLVGVVSVLEGEWHRKVRALWKLLEREHGWRDVQTFSHPDLSFQAGRTADPRLAAMGLRDLVAAYLPVDLQIEGVGHFDRNTIYLKVVRTEQMDRLHRAVNGLLGRCCRDLFEQYTPERWVPHITLAMGDLDEENFERAWAALNSEGICFEQQLHNLCLI